MGAPTGDSVLKPVVFLICLLGTFIVVTQAMTDTISSNQQNTFDAPDYMQPPDYLTMFNLSTTDWNFFNADSTGTHPRHVDARTGGADEAKLVPDYPVGCHKTNELEKFTSNQETTHPITVWAVCKWFGEVHRDRHELYFYQHGGTLGLQDYQRLSRFPEDYTRMENRTSGVTWYVGTVQLRHAYYIMLSGNYSGGSTYNSIMAWHFDLDVYELRDTNASADPWTIVAQFFTLSLPGIPQWLNLLLMTPLMAGVGIVAFILIRGALPF